jgi:hypothetical protein
MSAANNEAIQAETGTKNAASLRVFRGLGRRSNPGRNKNIKRIFVCRMLLDCRAALAKTELKGSRLEP